MARFKLELDPDPGFTIIGISCHERHYRLCWALNRSMGMQLTRRRTDITAPSGHRQARFATFDHIDPETNARCTLVENHGGGDLLMREYRQADYFMVVDDLLASSIPGLLERVRRTDFVLAAFPVELRTMKAGHKLLE
jgi:hypothetical protein